MYILLRANTRITFSSSFSSPPNSFNNMCIMHWHLTNPDLKLWKQNGLKVKDGICKISTPLYTFRPHHYCRYIAISIKHRENVSSIGMNNWTSLMMLGEVSLWSLRDTEVLLTMWSGTWPSREWVCPKTCNQCQSPKHCIQPSKNTYIIIIM